MDERRKFAYRHLLYRAMLDIRGIQWIGWPSHRAWRALNPLFWRREWRRVRYAGALADWMHNLAEYSARDFQGFREGWFWRWFEEVRSQYPEFEPEHYRQEFKRLARRPPEDGPHAEPGAGADPADG